MKPALLSRLLLVALALSAAGSLRAVPVIGPPVNQASFETPASPAYAIAQGAMFAVFGSDMGPGDLAVATAFPLTTNLSGTSVQVTVGGRTVDCFLVFASAGQLAAILPSTTPLGEGAITVTYNGDTSAPQPITVAANAVGMFTIPQNGQGPAVITDVDFNVNTYMSSFAPGDVAIAWVTGLGARTADDRAVPEDLKERYQVEVGVGGVSARVLYAGPSGCCAAVDQIVFEIPGGGPGTAQSATAADPSNKRMGCHVPVVVKAGGALSNFASMSVADDGPVCGDDHGFSSEEVARMHDRGSLPFLNVRATRLNDSSAVTLRAASASVVAEGGFPRQGVRPQVVEANAGMAGPGTFYRSGPPTACSCLLDFTGRLRNRAVERLLPPDDARAQLDVDGRPIFDGTVSELLSQAGIPIDPSASPVELLRLRLNVPGQGDFDGDYDFPSDPLFDFLDNLAAFDVLLEELDEIDDFEEYVEDLKDDLGPIAGARATALATLFFAGAGGELQAIDLFCVDALMDPFVFAAVQAAAEDSDLIGAELFFLLGLDHDHEHFGPDDEGLDDEDFVALVEQDASRATPEVVFLDIQDAALRTYSIPATPVVAYTAALSGAAGSANCNVNVNNLGVGVGCAHNLPNASGFGVWGQGSETPLATGVLQGGNQFSLSLGLSSWTVGQTAPTQTPDLAAAGEIEIRIFSETDSISGPLTPAQ